jgi:hypothetical protein
MEATMLRNLVICPVLIVALVFSGAPASVSAAVITTQQAMALEARAALEADVRGKLARADVRQAMLRLGADPAEADARVAALSDTELLRLQGQLDRLPAGGDALAVIGIVFIVLLILEITGVINIFRRV